MGVFELIADFAILFGKDVYSKSLSSIFMGFCQNTAANVRQVGIQKSALLAEKFKQDWVVNEFIPIIKRDYNIDKKGYNYRMCCLMSLAVVMPFITKDQVTREIIPMLV